MMVPGILLVTMPAQNGGMRDKEIAHCSGTASCTTNLVQLIYKHPARSAVNQERPEIGHAGRVYLEGKKTYISFFVWVASLNTDREFAGRFGRGARPRTRNPPRRTMGSTSSSLVTIPRITPSTTCQKWLAWTTLPWGTPG
jgi:hypothetical protein